MRMRKKKWQDDFLSQNLKYLIKEPSQFKNKWKSHFNFLTMHLEIGSGKGDYWLKMANMYPDVLFVALEKDPACVAVSLKKALDLKLNNAFIIIGDASNLLEFFGEKEVDVLHLNFSDPWPKKGHHKRRLTAHTFIDNYRFVLVNNGQIQLKTDNSDLFGYSISSLSMAKFICVDCDLNFRKTSKEFDAISEYEQKFMDLGQPIYRCVFIKGE